jgi:acetyl-CoA synthetase
MREGAGSKGGAGQVTAEQFYSIEEAAGLLHVSQKALRDWLRAGKIRGVKLGRVWRIPESALDELAQGGTKKPEDSGEG